jgi:hypothetical protein
MLLTDKVKYRNKLIPVNELKPNSDKKVWVMCPSCKMVRQIYWKVFVKSGSYLCHVCANNAKRKDIEIGKRFGKLVVIDNRRSSFSICQCDCGEITEINNANLKNNHTTTCGCLKLDNFKNAKVCKKEAHGNWKGGISHENELIRNSVNYKNWRVSVFKRDDYTCQKCGQIGYSLNAHHIESFANNKDKRTDINNGITLCNKCHKKLHNIFGNKTTKNDLN